jgi:DMSO/TMAO reductase YedYZ molybdopterin-dependent catalytic subunit
MLLQRKIDDVLEGVHLSDLLHEEAEVRERVGLVAVAPMAAGPEEARGRRPALPVLPA